jgi:hypothetical protein
MNISWYKLDTTKFRGTNFRLDGHFWDVTSKTQNSQKDMGGNLDFLESRSLYPIQILYIYIYIYILILIFIYLVREKERERERESLYKEGGHNTCYDPLLKLTTS